MNRTWKVIFLILVAFLGVGLVVLFLSTHKIALFDPAGPVAAQERDLMVRMVLIMLAVVIPLFIVLCTFAWKYRAGNKGRVYDLEQPHRAWTELFLWVIPVAVVAALWVLTWQSAHVLDPSVPVSSNNADALTVEVVALPWKWLFIYPSQNIATVNFIEFPEGVPIHFELTADAPMSSFWIPQLGSQIYAMAAMETQLNLMASTTGEFVGKDTEINGAGYSGMTFTANSVSQSDFDDWVSRIKAMPNALDQNAYDALAAPSSDNPPAYYSSVTSGLFNSIMMKFMEPTSTQMMPEASDVEPSASPTVPAMPGMQM